MKKIKNKISNGFRTFILVISTLSFFALFNIVSASEQFSFSPYIDLSRQDLAGESWLAPIANPSKNNELFLTTVNGKLYRTDGQKVESNSIFDFTSHLKEHSPLRFTAITLHPNFNLLDQIGSKTIYTAHIEPLNVKSKNDRLYESDTDKTYTHDAVILEWRINDSKINDIKLTEVREIIRIATTSADIEINQLAFNTLLKSWDDNFGLLFISLDSDKALASLPLYSGAILRVNPQKFGSINYSIPQSNPFLSEQDITDEIVILGVQKTYQMMWTKYTKSNMVLTHGYNSDVLMSLVKLGSNFLLKPPVDNLFKTRIQASTLTNQYYNGRELNSLRNKFIFLNHTNKNWQLESVSLNKPLEPKTELVLSTNDFSSLNQLSLYSPREDEILMWDETKSIIYKLTPNIVAIKAPVDLIPTQKTAADTTTTNNLADKDTIYQIAIGAGIAFILLVLFFIRHKYQSLFSKTKTLLRTNYARFIFDTTSKDVLLYRRHEAGVDKVIPIEDIYSSEVFLNEKSVCDVNSAEGKNFSNEIDKEMRRCFEAEHRLKMVDQKVRKIHVKLSTKKGEEILICSYLREGNQRLTKDTFHSVIEEVLDWQWYLSSCLHTDTTPERAQKKITKKPKERVMKSHLAKPVSVLEKLKPENTTVTEKSTLTEIPAEQAANQNLVDSLNKLATLKEKGYLTEDEFLAAKKKVLTTITDITKK